jgi:cholinesterase
VAVVDKLMSFYPETTSKEEQLFDPPLGSINKKSIYDRIEQLYGDLEINAAHKLMCQSFSQLASCYSYLFSSMPLKIYDPRMGIVHGAEMGSFFKDLDGPDLEHDPLWDRGEGFHEMSNLMRTMWAGFISSLDPNTGLKDTRTLWPKYSHVEPQHYIFRENVSGCEIERSGYRSDAIEYINQIQHSVFRK